MAMHGCPCMFIGQLGGAASTPSVLPQFYEQFQQFHLELNDHLIPMESDLWYAFAHLARMKTAQNVQSRALRDIELEVIQQRRAFGQLQDY
ncbi:hypothetical protein Dimus_025664 [Dionaea muscipula]